MELQESIGPLLIHHSLKLTVAESCTGGLIGHMITDVPGSSEYYLGSVTAYSYEAKRFLLKVDSDNLLKYGAVSREIALEMAKGVRQAFAGKEIPIKQVLGLSATGIAGPDGGLPGKPVGLVWIGLSTPDGDWAWKFIWDSDRSGNKFLSAKKALAILHGYLLGNLLPETETAGAK
ncbi:MAG: CinA family protein [Bellilinea sp.]